MAMPPMPLRYRAYPQPGAKNNTIDKKTKVCKSCETSTKKRR